MHPVITDQAINDAEQALFGRLGIFDPERIDFIRNLETLDLQAIPGSGKTTVLLAKLLVLSKHQPFPDQAGILVLSHTNAAVDQIRQKLGSAAPALFSYPNFVGTIQSFVDIFLAVPYFEHCFAFRPDFIDAEAYRTRMEKRIGNFITPSGYSRQEINNARSYLVGNEEKGLTHSYRFAVDENEELILTDGLNGRELTFTKPRRRNQKNYVDFTPAEKQKIKEWLRDSKVLLWKEDRVIHYDDAYYLANRYLSKFPRVRTILRRRFRYVFVDEMQDMDVHQVQLLDRVFQGAREPYQTFQRIGDKNQAIFSYDVKLDNVWEDRPKVLTLTKSMRLSTAIAKKVKPFGLVQVELEGANHELNSKNIQPRIIVYDDNTVTETIPRFAEIIKQLRESNDLPTEKGQKYKAVGWRRFSDEDRKTIVKSYFPSFNSEKRKVNVDCNCLEDHLLGIDSNDFSSKLFTDTIHNAIIKILTLESILDRDIQFSTTRLRNRLRYEYEDLYVEYRHLVFRMSQEHVRGNLNQVKDLLSALLIRLAECLGHDAALSTATLDFINRKTTLVPSGTEVRKADNVYERDGVQIHIGTVHSVKGETHTVTLYLETFYQSDRGRSFESERLIEQLKGTQISPTAGVRTRQSSRVAYVGLSRPTHLLCFAAHKDRIRGHESELEGNGWLIDKTLVECVN